MRRHSRGIAATKTAGGVRRPGLRWILAMATGAVLVGAHAQSDQERAVERLEQAGRRIAETPCASPSRKVRREPHLFDEDLEVEWTTLRCPGAEAEWVSSERTQFTVKRVNSVMVRGTDPRIAAELRVGASISGARQVLGSPYKEDDESIHYEAENTAKIMLVHDGQRILWIRWLWPHLD